MIQRIQTLFLLLASACMLIAVVTPLAKFYAGTEIIVFEALGINEGGNIVNSTWGLFAVGAISSLLALITVFLYKTRMIQIRVSIQFRNIGIGVIMPIIAIILTYLAIRKIGADEVLVRSLDRLRG